MVNTTVSVTKETHKMLLKIKHKMEDESNNVKKISEVIAFLCKYYEGK